MGVYGMSSDSRDCGQTFNPLAGKVERVNSTPDPKNFKILEKEIINGYPIIMVNYPGVLNYEGNKILMYRKNFNFDLIKDRIDPHFFTENDSPIARFEPTQYGWVLAEILAKNLP